MSALFITLVLFSQVGVPNPPASAAVVPSPSATESVDDLRTWLLARLIVDMSFDVQKSGEVERMLNRMDERQMRALVDAYKEKSERKAQSSVVQKETSQQQSLDQAKLDLQQAEAYRDHLKREYDRSLLQGHMTQNLVFQNAVNSQRMMYMTNGPIGYSSLGYGGLGYGAMSYGGFGFGAPGFGGPVFYGPGMRVW
ncbi:MAG: hypothetical protein WCH39_16665 [Schlesneria sp.]